MPAFIAALRERDGVANRLLEFLILTNVRTGTALGAEWREFDLDAGVRMVQASKLKDRKHRREPFRVPLPPGAVAMLRELEAIRVSRFVFPSAIGKPLSNMAMLVLLKRMNSGETK